jgi:hypothetical protein
MASYASYKKITSEGIPDGAITNSKLAPGAGAQRKVRWIYNERGLRCHQCTIAGNCCEQANGKCCYWCVPDNVYQVTFEIWGGGGGGPGHTCCNNCSFAVGGFGGNYAIKTIATNPGCQYSVCAGGSWRCEKSHTCTAGMGCRSYVNGHNLSNFCVDGGCPGWMCNGDAWGQRHAVLNCANCRICGIFGADFGMNGGGGIKAGTTTCRCHGQTSWTGTGAGIGTYMATQTNEAWCACGCHVNWPAGGGTPGTSSYCNNWAKCCAGGSGQGGSGIVKITFA